MTTPEPRPGRAGADPDGQTPTVAVESGPPLRPTGGPRRDQRIGELVFAIAVAALGGFILATTGDIYQPPSSTTVGPRVFPYVVGTGLLLIGVLLVVAVLRGRLGSPEASEDVDADARTSWGTVALLVVVLLVHVNLIVPAGWPIAAAALFAGSAFVLGNRQPVRTCLIAVALGIGLHLLFGQVLGVSLPAGPLLSGIPGFD